MKYSEDIFFSKNRSHIESLLFYLFNSLVDISINEEIINWLGHSNLPILAPLELLMERMTI